MSTIKLAILGYNTDAGKALFDLVEAEKLPIEELYPIAYGASQYDAVSLLGKNYAIEAPDEFDFTKANIVLFLGSSGDARKLIPIAKESGALVIDATMLDNETPAYVYLNGLESSEFEDALVDQHIIPMSSSATMLAHILKPFSEELGLNRAVVTLMEAVSGLGEEGARELARETIALLNIHPIEPKLFDTQTAFNIHTCIGSCTADGTTTHEYEIVRQLEQVIGGVKDGVNLTCVLAPIFYGHTATLTLTTSPNTTLEDIRRVINDSPVMELVEDEEVTPAKFGTNEERIIISRLRPDTRNPGTFSLVAVMDNARIGLASNCLGILQMLAQRD